MANIISNLAISPLFRQRYPKVRLDESRMIVKSGKFVTAGAALSI